MKVLEIYFSPTGGTKKVTDELSQALSDDIERVDITVNAFGGEIKITDEDLCVIGVPSFGGRVPAVAVERISQISGNGAKAVLVCAYGNRAFEDTLVELEDAATKAGFEIIAAIAAVAEHSIDRTYAAGRPDAADRTTLRSFAAKISDKLQSGNDSVPMIPGNRPYKKRGGGGIVPKPDKSCTKCGICAENCPVGAIEKEDPSKTDKNKCISCMRCISVCPQKARKANPVMLAAVNVMLKKVCAERKEYLLYI